MAMQPIPAYLRKSYQDFAGGLNTQDSALIVKQNQFTELDNSLVNDRGILEKAPGYELDGSPFPDAAASFIRMLHNYRRGATIDRLICAALDAGNTNATYKVDMKETSGDGSYDYIGYTTGTATFTNGSDLVTSGVGTAFSTHLKAGDKIKPDGTSVWYEILAVTSATALTLASNFAEATQAASSFKARIILHKDYIPVAITFNNNLVVSNGIDTPITYNGTTATLITDAQCPKAQFLEPHKNRVFSAVTESGPSSIFWSAVNDETTWEAEALEIVSANDNGNICRIKSFANSLLVFKDNGVIYQVVGDFDQDAVGEIAFIRRLDVPENIGTLAGRSVTVGNDGLCYFLAETGVYSVDARMNIVKISKKIDPTIANLVLKSTTTANKSYAYDTKAQWDAGTHSGTTANSAGTIRQFCDQYSVSGAQQGHNMASVAIDSNNIVHVVYMDTAEASSTYGIKYAQYAADGTEVLENIPDLRAQYAVSIAANATRVAIVATSNAGGADNKVSCIERFSDGTVTFTAGSNAVTGSGTSWLTELQAGARIKNKLDSTWYTVQAVTSDTALTLTTNFTDTAGSGQEYSAWTAVVHAGTNYPSSNVYAGSVAVAYATNDLGIAFTTSGGGIHFLGRVSGTWSTYAIATGAPVASLTNGHRASVAINGTDVYVSVTLSPDTMRGYKSTDGGVSWVVAENFAVSLTEADATQVSYNSSGQVLSGYGDGAIRFRNHTAGTTTNLDTTANSLCGGFAFYSGNSYALNIVGPSGYQAEKYIYESSSSVSSTTTNYLNKTYRVSQGMANNGATFVSCAFGADVGSLVIRRVAFRAIWTSNERSDSSLTAWNTIDLSGETTAGNTITRELATNSVSPASTFVSFTSGSIVSTNTANIYLVVKLTSVLASLAAGASWDSLIVNYTGVGTDGKMPSGIMYNNDLYISICESGEDANNKTLLLDDASGFSLLSYPMSCFARYKKALYGGSALNGDVFKLLRGYNNDGAAYTMTATSKEDLLGSVELDKEVNKIYVLFEVKESGSFVFSYRTDNFASVSESSWTSTTVDQTSAGIVHIPFVLPSFKSIQFRVTNANADQEVGIIGYVVLYHYLNVR